FCVNKPEVIIRLEQGAEPWTVKEPPDKRLLGQSLYTGQRGWEEESPGLLSPCYIDVRNVDDLININEENQGRHLWQVLIANSKTSSKERVDLGTTLNLHPVRNLNLSVNNGPDSGVTPAELRTWKSVSLPGEPDEVHAAERLKSPAITRKALRYAEAPGLHHMIQTLQQPLESSGEGRDFNKETLLFTRRRNLMGDSACQDDGYRKGCAVSAPIIQGSAWVGQTHCACNEWESSLFEKQAHLNLHKDFEGDHHKYNQSGNYFGTKLNLTQFQKMPVGEKAFEYNTGGKTFYKFSFLTKHEKIQAAHKPYELWKMSDNVTLKRCQRTLTGETPFVSKQCQRTYSWKSAVTLTENRQCTVVTVFEVWLNNRQHSVWELERRPLCFESLRLRVTPVAIPVSYRALQENVCCGFRFCGLKPPGDSRPPAG
ncbi:Zinc finger protein 717, partial [Galemys pyrenaicus]